MSSLPKTPIVRERTPRPKISHSCAGSPSTTFELTQNQSRCAEKSMPQHGTTPSFSAFLAKSDSPALQGEGRTAEGSPRWGDGVAASDGEAARAEALSPPPGPLTRADLPPPGGGVSLPKCRPCLLQAAAE